MKRTGMAGNNKGFSLKELLLLVGIIGAMLLITIPRIRSTIASKNYGIIQKNASELKYYAVIWAEKSIRAQDETHSTATLVDYYASLANQSGGVAAGSGQQWIATTRSNNWNINEGTTTNRSKGTTEYIPINGRALDDGSGLRGPTLEPEYTVEHLIPPKKTIKNPFNGVSVFRSPNYPPGQGRPVPGALALGFLQEPTSDSGYYYFAFAYQRTDSTTYDFSDDGTSFRAGSGLLTLPALRNGELFARIR